MEQFLTGSPSVNRRSSEQCAVYVGVQYIARRYVYTKEDQRSGYGKYLDLGSHIYTRKCIVYA